MNLNEQDDLSWVTLTEEFEKTLKLMSSPGDPLFITGKPGTGKSTLLKYFVAKSFMGVAVVAPTGIAAINVGCPTIDSLFKLAGSLVVM